MHYTGCYFLLNFTIATLLRLLSLITALSSLPSLWTVSSPHLANPMRPACPAGQMTNIDEVLGVTSPEAAAHERAVSETAAAASAAADEKPSQSGGDDRLLVFRIDSNVLLESLILFLALG